MFRVYKDFIQQMLLICLHYRDLGYDVRHAQEWATNNWWPRVRSEDARKDQQRKIPTALSFLEAPDFDLGAAAFNTLIETCVSLLVSARDDQGDRDLIDTIVRLLNLPYPRNTLAGSTLQHLRQAILLPEELVDLKRRLDTERFCANCAHPFALGEMTTYIANGDARSFFCTRCHRPSSVASDNDPTHSISISAIPGLDKLLMKKHLTGTPAPESLAAMAEELLGPPAPAVLPQNPQMIVFGRQDAPRVIRWDLGVPPPLGPQDPANAPAPPRRRR